MQYTLLYARLAGYVIYNGCVAARGGQLERRRYMSSFLEHFDCKRIVVASFERT